MKPCTFTFHCSGALPQGNPQQGKQCLYFVLNYYNKSMCTSPSGERLLLFIQTQSEIEGTNFNRASLLDNSGDVV